jgi:hypothetical protein
MNIHEIMMINVLHQLLKNIIMHLLNWIKSLLKTEILISKKRKRSRKLSRFDARFKCVTSFTELKIFNHFNRVKQWTKVEQKTIVRQFISMLTSLFINKWSHIVNFIKTLVDFVLLTQYRSHDDNTLQYLEHALHRMNAFKSMFRSHRSLNKKTNEKHFNFFKFHIMTHYAKFIRKFEIVNEYDISHDEAKHKYMIKKYYFKTNKQNDFQEQLIHHNNRRLNVLIMKNIIRHEKKRHMRFENNVIAINTRSIRDSLNLKFFNESMITIIQRRQRWNSILNSRNWCLIHELATRINAFDLISILTAFVREKRRATIEISSDVRKKFRRKKNVTWINDYYVNIHESLTCWIRSEHDYLNIKKLNEKKVRCKSRWQNKIDNWKRDFVWIQEDIEFIDEIDCSAFRKKIIKQLQLIMTIINSQRVDEHHKSIKYCEIFVNVMKSRNNERFNDIIEMISLKA